MELQVAFLSVLFELSIKEQAKEKWKHVRSWIHSCILYNFSQWYNYLYLSLPSSLNYKKKEKKLYSSFGTRGHWPAIFPSSSVRSVRDGINALWKSPYALHLASQKFPPTLPVRDGSSAGLTEDVPFSLTERPLYNWILISFINTVMYLGPTLYAGEHEGRKWLMSSQYQHIPSQRKLERTGAEIVQERSVSDWSDWTESGITDL